MAREKHGGRKAGTPNKLTMGAKANIMAVFDMLGGAEGFAEWAKDNRTEFYKHYAKLIPVEVANADNKPFMVGLLKSDIDG